MLESIKNFFNNFYFEFANFYVGYFSYFFREQLLYMLHKRLIYHEVQNQIILYTII